MRQGLGAIGMGVAIVVMGYVYRWSSSKGTKLPPWGPFDRDGRPLTLDEWKQSQVSFANGARLIGAIFVAFGIVLLIINSIHPIKPS